MKLIKDGKVVVIYSPGFGAGWYTWNKEYPDCLFDADLAQAILNGDSEEALTALAKEKWPDIYCGGLDAVEVEWLPLGSRFRVDEYDGSESIELLENINLFVA